MIPFVFPSDSFLHIFDIQAPIIRLHFGEDGVAPVIDTEVAVAINVNEGTMTSSPGPIPKDVMQR